MSEPMTRRTMLGVSSAVGLGAVTTMTLPGQPTNGTVLASDDAEQDPPLVIAGVSAPTSLDPALSVDTETERVCRQIFETLLGVDRDTGSTAPLLAEEWDVSDDGLRYTFTLRDGVLFHDGTTCDAAAVVANIERWGRLDQLYGQGNIERSPTLAFVSVFGGFLDDPACMMDSVEAEDERTVILTLNEPIVYLPQALTMPAFSIASPEVLSDTDPGLVSRRPVGTGAYRWMPSEDSEGSEIALEAFEDYWDGAPEISRVEVRALPRSFDRLRELQRGRLDVYDYITADNLRPLVQSGRLILQRDPFSVLYIGFNLNHPVLDDLRMRQAVAHAIDRTPLVDRFFLDGTRTAHQFTPPALGVQSEAVERYGYDPTEAEQLLEEAGYDGEPLRFYYPMHATRSYLPRPEAIYAAIAADLTAAGLVIEPKPVAWEDDYLETLLNDDARALHLLGRNGGYRSANSFLGPLFGRQTEEFNYDSATVRRLIDRARRTSSEERRTELYREIAEHVSEDLPALPVAYPISGLALGREISDYPMSPVLHELFRDIRR
ncbi:ABC transporter substrate-binding protein [Nesterenkonia aerolata]|uniref:ABC transporter substrate-binding protein n=1 Tax=Nesterenkonia aerolata TaxID=3074079 RepID=A0ABU2DSS0_9MICC|nr:ABC transporter substrate-binding protein [Nesterenkonia sp. LY-0111]MDR8019543.1 ABC transporter substrate-binding protein [Nesterenkonia sp. LY-0111]